MPSRLLLAALFSLTALIGAGPATAIDETKPVHKCGLLVKDGDKDATEPNAAPNTDPHHDNMEIKGFFFKHEPAKGADATTVNIIIKDLTRDLPTGNTAINWSMKYTFNEKVYFVRSVVDYSGGEAHEWGEFTATGAPAGVSGTFQYKGETPGKLHEGPDGVVQIVIPQDNGGKAGSTISNLEVSSNTGKSAVPTAAATPSRGVAYPNDTATTGKYTAAACDAATAPPTTAPSGPAPAPAPSGTGSSTPAATTGPAALPVKLASAKVKAPKKKSLALKLTSSEKITGVVAQLRSASGTVAKGKLAAISGKGTLKLKLAKKLKKGKYTLDLVGKDASGAQRSTSAALTVR
jgi:hypothetical protein